MNYIKELELNPKKLAIIFGANLAVILLVTSYIKPKNTYLSNHKQIEKSKLKQDLTHSAIGLTSSLPEISTDLENRIVQSTISELREGLDNGEFTCEQLLLTYLHRLRKIGLNHHCISDVLIDEALDQARILDKELKSGHKRGLFHGIPISIKDIISVKGMRSSIGLTKFADNAQTRDSLIIDALRQQGAIFYVTGSVPQGLSSYETINLMTGTALNPFSIHRTPGGSSGGDAALVALGCTSLGIDTDLYGSIRVPASFCGLFGFKPTSNRVSKFGPSDFFQPYPCLATAIGPIGKSTDDCALFMQAACSEYVYRRDSAIPPILWNEEIYKERRNMKIGYISNNSYWPLPKCMIRALEIAKAALIELGHELVPIELPDMDQINELLASIYSNSAKKDIGEPRIHQGKFVKAKSWVSRIKRFFERKRTKESFYTHAANLKTGFEYVKNMIKVTNMKKEFLQMWADKEIDVIIGPYPVPAMLHNSFEELYPGFAYITFFNLLDCPAGNVPVSSVNEDEQFYEETGENWTKVMNRNMQNSKGLPLGVQVVAPPFREELCLNVMRQIEEKTLFRKTHKSNLASLGDIINK